MLNPTHKKTKKWKEAAGGEKRKSDEHLDRRDVPVAEPTAHFRTPQEIA